MNEFLPKLKKVLPPLFFLILFAIAYIYRNSFFQNIFITLGFSIDALITILSYTIGITLWLCFAWFITRIIDVFFWEWFVETRLQKHIPRLIKQMVHVFVYFVCILGIIGVIFEKSVTSILTASGIIGIIVGFAIKNLIADIFNGIVINLDKPFKIGDYILIHDKNPPILAKVLEVTWQSTRLKTLLDHTLIVPNRTICMTAISNLSRNRGAIESVGFERMT